MDRTAVFVELARQGVAKAVVNFSGGGDEGGVDSIELYNAAGENFREMQEHYPNQRWNPATRSYDPETGLTIEQELSVALCKPVYDKYHSFAGEFHVHGTVTWEVAAGTCKMNGAESVETYEDFDEDVE
jgi:hypothetical protein